MIIVFLSVMPTYQRRKRDDECNAIDFSLFGIINFSIIISLSPLNNWPMCNNNNTRTLNYIASCLTFIILTKAQDPIGYKKDDIMIHPHSRWWHLLCFLGGSVSIYFDEWLWCVFTFLLVLFDSSIQAHTHTHTHIPYHQIALHWSSMMFILFATPHWATINRLMTTLYISPRSLRIIQCMQMVYMHACMHCVVLCCVVCAALLMLHLCIESNRIKSNRIELHGDDDGDYGGGEKREKGSVFEEQLMLLLLLLLCESARWLMYSHKRLQKQLTEAWDPRFLELLSLPWMSERRHNPNNNNTL